MKPVKITILFLFFCPLLISQVNQEWAVRYNNPNKIYDIAISCAIDKDGNIYVTGTSSDNISSSQYTTIKYDPNGIQKWFAVYSGPVSGVNSPSVISVDPAGNIIVTGSSEGSGTGDDIATIKYSSEGTQLWTARYSSPGNSTDQAMDMCIDLQGNIYITGCCEYGISEFVTLKYNSNGVLQWIVRYKGSKTFGSISCSISLDGLGNIYIAGKCTLGYNNWEYGLIKYNNNGVLKWVTAHAGSASGSGVACNIVADQQGDLYLASDIYRTSSGYDFLTVKYNANGIKQWEAIYNGFANGEDGATAITLDKSGNICITGYSNSSITNYDCVTIKYNKDGEQLWLARYDRGINNYDRGSRIITDLNDNVYVTGYSEGGINSGYDFLTLKYNSSGIQQWVMTHNGSDNNTDISRSIKLDSLGNVYITGWTSEVMAASDFTTIKYSQLIGINPVSSDIPRLFKLYQNYPNPFNPVTKIRFDLPTTGKHSPSPLERAGVRLIVYDILGREVSTLVNEYLKPGLYEVDFDGSGFASGVYFYSLLTSEFTETKKLILLK